MANSATATIRTAGETGRGGGGGAPGGSGGWGSPGRACVPQQAYVTGMAVAICGICMFFLSLVSASVVRKGLGAPDWPPLALPLVLWLDSAILIASSLTFWRAQQLVLGPDEASFRHWWDVTTILGILFLAGQVIAWRQMVFAGAHAATSAAAGFFYVFTGAHGLHLAGGIVALLLGRMRPPRWLTQETVTQVVGLYWHFLTVLWLALFLFFLWETHS